MIKDNQKYFNRLHVCIDALLVVITYLLAWFLKFKSGIAFFMRDVAAGTLDRQTYFSALLVIVPGYLILYYLFNLYAAKRASSMKRDIWNVIKANTVGLFLFLGILYVIRQPHFSRTMLFYFYVLNICLDGAFRIIVFMVLQSLRARGYNVKYILLVGYSRAAEQYIDRVRHNPQWGYVVRGILDDSIPRGTEYKGVRVIGKIDNLFYILPQNKLDEIAITLALEQYGRLKEIVGLCEKSGVHTKFIPDYNSVIPSRPYTEDVDGLPVINIRRVPLTNTLNIIVKRTFDLVAGLLITVIVSPLLLVIAIAVKVTSPGPVIFKQERVGLHNKPFQMYKFRSMRMQTPEDEEKEWTTKGDPRVTGIGRFLRKTSLDEFPQLFNVIMGDMSLVGPRPERPFFVEKFKEEIPRYMIKHQVRPGMTGWAQINGFRGDSSIRKRIDCDLYYIENWTMGLDLKILFLTIFKGFINKNAY
ncbi:MAG: undecaprenyl-phosphate glucose phosphotransferase [Lachnospiraceae bacterium]|nr:undecaprenyl-phosphate glucose phosphotransferase [Lachnospiraceae bacterium]MCR5338494.1 undecaprenyl-phosphate glucose phosphotransferase [Lachnospiraceae bacterium]